ncbi:MAG: methylenetetrahydrofolate reductase [NAD(P)H] [Deltaproteobacteria bacterium]|nr:methylenetetrahydrofolate reductase [NAD(P)H] [Deltaproteobacteria bacterium]
MHIRDLFKQKKFILSFEVFPPTREGNLENLFVTIKELSDLKPDFISVTYGAGGSTREKTLEIASRVKKDFNTEALAHLTCVQSTKDDIARILDLFKDENIENILALRGDPPAGAEKFIRTEGGFGYANELVSFIRRRNHFSIGVAGYPEGHIEAPSLDADMLNLKRKVDAGADFITTQLFFNNEAFYRFRDRAWTMGIKIPILPGVFPILNYKQVQRIVCLCGATIPSALGEKIDKLKDKHEEVENYGIEYAMSQADDLIRNDVSGLHIYSMNRSEPVKRILQELSYPR